MNERMRRNVAGVVLPVAGLVAVVVASLTTDVPDPLATHWDLGGTPDGSMATPTFITVILVLAGLGAAATFVASRRSIIARGDLSASVAIATFLQWVFVGVGVTTLLANHDVGTWTDARSLSLPAALLVPLSAIVVAGAAGRVVVAVGSSPERTDVTRPTAAKGADERLVWIRQMNSTWPLALGGALGLIGAASVLTLGVFVGVALLVAGAAVAMFATVRVTADRRGLTIGYGPFGWPRSRIGLDRIVRAETIDVRPMQHGGWGYRGSIRVFGRAAVVVRSGEGIQLDLTGDQHFVVTVDHADDGADAINDLVAASTPVSPT